MKENQVSDYPTPKGRLLIIGGAENKGEDEAKEKQTPSDFERLQILKRFITLTGKGDPALEIITSASTEGDESFEDYRKVFEELKISSVGHIHHTTRQQVIEDDSLIERMKKADAVFFAGGDQLKYTQINGGTEFLTALKFRYINEEVVIAGTSAGAMAMSTPMIYAGNDEVQEIGGMIKITTGLEFLKDVCIDTHFVHRGRFVRMAQVIATNPTCVGIGIEEDTAVIIQNGRELEVVGTGTIIIIEGFNITKANIEKFTDNNPVSIHNLKVHIMSDSDTYLIPQTNPLHT